MINQRTCVSAEASTIEGATGRACPRPHVSLVVDDQLGAGDDCNFPSIFPPVDSREFR